MNWLAQAVARMTMAWWDNKFIDLCKNLEIDILMYFRYVDDTDQLVIPPPAGTRYLDGRLKINQETIESDKDRPRDAVAGELIQTIADSVSPMIKVTIDVCSNHDDRKMPVLDVKQWLETTNGVPQILHQFYKKPMASKLTLRAHTAYSKSQMKAVLIQEILRRLRNCSPESTLQEKGKHLTEFAKSMQASGHPEKMRQTVFRIAVTRYMKELERHEKGEGDMYRSREMRSDQIYALGGKRDKGNWFRDRENKKNDRITSVMIVPYTGGILSDKIRKGLTSCKEPKGIRTRIQEAGGRKLKDSLMKADPFLGNRCFREDCPVVTRDAEGCHETCFQGHATYIAKCKPCTEDRDRAIRNGTREEDLPPEPIYIGETSRGLYERHKGHVIQYKAGKDESGFMLRHAADRHNGDKNIAFTMKKTATDGDPLRRVIRESVQILAARENERINLMNGKDEYFGVRVVSTNFSQE